MLIYNPNQQEIPEDLEKPLEERQMGGLGIYLAKINVDQLIYERVHLQNSSLPEINRNSLIVNLESSRISNLFIAILLDLYKISPDKPPSLTSDPASAKDARERASWGFGGNIVYK